MSTSSLSPDEIRAAAAIHHELGPDYGDAVVESFIDKVGREIDARVDARLARVQPVPQVVPQQARDRSFALAIVSIALGIPITAIVVAAGSHPVGLGGLLIVWLAIAVINVASALHNRPGPDRR